jgi:hypothetical protein
MVAWNHPMKDADPGPMPRSRSSISPTEDGEHFAVDLLSVSYLISFRFSERRNWKLRVFLALTPPA